MHRRRLHSTLCLHFFIPPLSLPRRHRHYDLTFAAAATFNFVAYFPSDFDYDREDDIKTERGRNQSGCLSRSSLLDRSVNERRTCTSFDSHETVRYSRPRPPPSLKGQKYFFSINFKCFKVHPPELSSDRSSEMGALRQASTSRHLASAIKFWTNQKQIWVNNNKLSGYQK